jgi:hypothetical protein
MRRHLRALTIALGLLAAPAAWAGDPEPDSDAVQVDEMMAEDDTISLETAGFSEPRKRSALRLHTQSRFVPDQSLGPGHTTLYRPDLRARVTIPLSKRALLRVTALAGLNRYKFRGGDPFLLGNKSMFGDSLTVYRTLLDLDGAYRLNDESFFLIRDGEIWSLLGGLFLGADFESGTFDDGLSGGVNFALGYEMDGKLRVALGARIQTSIEDGGIDVSPGGSFRWNITEDLTLRDRGYGAQLEYRLTPDLELFVSGFRDTDQFTLKTVAGIDDLTLRDRMILVGGGLEWKYSRHLRVNAEMGAVTWRRFRVHSDDFGTLVSQRGDASPYFEVRFEFRP